MTTKFRRLNNDEYRSREYLTWEEMKILIKAAGERGRHRVRDQALLLMSFRHDGKKLDFDNTLINYLFIY